MWQKQKCAIFTPQDIGHIDSAAAVISWNFWVQPNQYSFYVHTFISALRWYDMDNTTYY